MYVGTRKESYITGIIERELHIAYCSHETFLKLFLSSYYGIRKYSKSRHSCSRICTGVVTQICTYVHYMHFCNYAVVSVKDKMFLLLV